MTAPGPDQPVALVTGASRGLGRAIAVALAPRFHLVLTARIQGGLEETDDLISGAGGQSTLLPLDLRDGEAVDAIGPSIAARFGRLDAFVHCAAVLGPLTPVSHLSIQAWAELVAVNMTAGLRLIRTCDPLLRAAPSGRAVIVTDAVARDPRAYWGPYGATKAGLAHLAQAWAAETATTSLRVLLFEPGAMATRLRRLAMPGEDQAALLDPATVAPRIAAWCAEAER